MFEIIMCVLEPFIVLAMVFVPFAILGVICELIKYAIVKIAERKGIL